MKKILSMLLVVALMMGSIGTFALAADTVVKFRFGNGEIVVQYGEKTTKAKASPTNPSGAIGANSKGQILVAYVDASGKTKAVNLGVVSTEIQIYGEVNLLNLAANLDGVKVGLAKNCTAAKVNNRSSELEVAKGATAGKIASISPLSTVINGAVKQLHSKSATGKTVVNGSVDVARAEGGAELAISGTVKEAQAKDGGNVVVNKGSKVTTAKSVGGNVAVEAEASVGTISAKDSKLDIKGSTTTLEATGKTDVSVGATGDVKTISAKNDTTLNVAGKAGAITAGDSTSVNVEKGAVADSVALDGNSKAAVAGNVTSNVSAQGNAAVEAKEGSKIAEVSAKGEASVKAVSGAYVGAIAAEEKSSLSMEKGSESLNVKVSGDAKADVAGNANNIAVSGNSTLKLESGSNVGTVDNKDASNKVDMAAGSKIGAVTNDKNLTNNGGTIDPSIKDGVVSEKPIESTPTVVPSSSAAPSTGPSASVAPTASTSVPPVPVVPTVPPAIVPSPTPIAINGVVVKTAVEPSATPSPVTLTGTFPTQAGNVQLPAAGSYNYYQFEYSVTGTVGTVTMTITAPDGKTTQSPTVPAIKDGKITMTGRFDSTTAVGAWKYELKVGGVVKSTVTLTTLKAPVIVKSASVVDNKTVEVTLSEKPEATLTVADFAAATDAAQNGAFATTNAITGATPKEDNTVYTLTLTNAITDGHFVKISQAATNSKLGAGFATAKYTVGIKSVEATSETTLKVTLNGTPATDLTASHFKVKVVDTAVTPSSVTKDGSNSAIYTITLTKAMTNGQRWSVAPIAPLAVGDAKTGLFVKLSKVTWAPPADKVAPNVVLGKDHSATLTPDPTTGIGTIAIIAKDVPQHLNGAGTVGVWVGALLEAPAGITTSNNIKVAASKTDEPPPTPSTKPGLFFKGDQVVGEHDTAVNKDKYYLAIYVSAKDATPTKYYTVDWDGSDPVYAPETYKLDVSGVTTSAVATITNAAGSDVKAAALTDEIFKAAGLTGYDAANLASYKATIAAATTIADVAAINKIIADVNAAVVALWDTEATKIKQNKTNWTISTHTDVVKIDSTGRKITITLPAVSDTNYSTQATNNRIYLGNTNRAQDASNDCFTYFLGTAGSITGTEESLVVPTAGVTVVNMAAICFESTAIENTYTMFRVLKDTAVTVTGTGNSSVGTKVTSSAWTIMTNPSASKTVTYVAPSKAEEVTNPIKVVINYEVKQATA